MQSKDNNSKTKLIFLLEVLVFSLCCIACIKLFSACSGLVITGYSKRVADKWLNTDLAKAIIPYEKFKKMYTVDKSTDEFKGKLNLQSIGTSLELNGTLIFVRQIQ